MKKSLCVLLLFSLGYTLNAQETSNEKADIFERKHEVRLGAIKLLSGPIFEGSYEYIKSSNQGYGAYLLVNLNSDNEWFENFAITPYYRMYFQTNEDYGAKGFFVEGFTSFFSSDYNIEDIIEGEENNEEFDIAIGLSLGKKWINTSGFVFEFKFGAGRNLLGNADSDVIIKGDFYIGYRF